MRPPVRGHTVKLRGLWQHPATGILYHRTRAGGKTTLTPLPDLPTDHPDFLAAFIAAARSHAPPSAPKSGSLASHWRALLASDTFATLSTSYQGIMAREGALIAAGVGTAPARGLQSRHVRADVAQSGNPLARHKAWRFWGAWAFERGLISADPTRDVRRPVQAKTDGHPPWTATAITAYRTRWPIGTVPRAAMELLHWTGARISDAVRLGPGMIGRDGVLSYRQIKTRDPAYVPWSCDLPAYADPADLAMMLAAIKPLAGQMTFLATTTGRTRSVNALGTLIRESAQAAGLYLSAHGLRKTRAIALVEGGATTHHACAWTGHKTLGEIERYTAAMNRRKAVIGTPADHKNMGVESEIRASNPKT